MAKAPTPEPKSNIGNTFAQQIEAVAAHAQSLYRSVVERTPANWYRPANFWGDLFAMHDLSEALSRQEQADDFRKAVADPDSPGTTGDLQSIQLQGDMVACLERAFRARHATTCRTRIQPAGRDYGHGHPYGPVRLGLFGHVADIDRLNKGEPG